MITIDNYRQESLPPGERRALSSSAPAPKLGNSMDNTPEMDLIDQVLAGRSLISMKPQAMSSYTQAQKATLSELPQKMEQLEQLQQLNRDNQASARATPPPREETPPRGNEIYIHLRNKVYV